MVVHGRQRIGNILLVPETVPAVLRLPVNDVPRYAECFLHDGYASLVLAGVWDCSVYGPGNVRFPAPGIRVGRLHAVGFLGV